MTVSHYDTGWYARHPAVYAKLLSATRAWHLLYSEEKQHADVREAYFNSKDLANNHTNMWYVTKQK